MKINRNDKGFPQGYITATLNKSGTPRFIAVTKENFPKLYEALTEECEFRGIERPACFIDTESEVYPLAYARGELEAIFITPKTYEIMNKDELRAVVAHEVKHLYSGLAKSNKELRLIEKDCDRAAVESTSYKTVQSYVDKAMAIMVETKVPLPVFSKFVKRFNRSFPSLIAENFWIPLDVEHPSPARRMQEKRQHEKTLNQTKTR